MNNGYFNQNGFTNKNISNGVPNKPPKLPPGL
jgi:hypothetical protein